MAKEIELKYGCNPNQIPAKIYKQNGELPFKVLNGRPGYINFMDALNAWQLVKELKLATGYPAAASFKHVSPAGAAIGTPLSPELARACWVDDLELSPLACAYAKARGADRMSSFGDFIALSDIVDKETATLIAREVSDGIIAPGYSDEAFEILLKKRKGNYNIIQIDESYVPEEVEHKEIFGITFEQKRNNVQITKDILNNVVTANKEIPEDKKLDLLIATITLKYTQSNSVCYAYKGQAIGVGAGQQSRIHCTRLAGQKADNWFLRQHPKILGLKFKDGIGRPDRDNIIDNLLVQKPSFFDNYDFSVLFEEKPDLLSEEEKEEWLSKIDGVSLSSDAFFPFGDNIERAVKSGVRYIAETGGSVRDDQVIETCDKFGVVMAFTGIRLFHH